MSDKPKKHFRNQLEPNQTISLEQFAKEHGTTPGSARKWALERGIRIHKIGNARIFWSSDLMDYFQDHSPAAYPVQ